MGLEQALRQAQDGDTIELLSGDYKGQHVLLDQRRLVLRGVGQAPVFHGQGKVSLHKALWTVRGGDVRIENIEFRGARSADANGAGVRLEGGRLKIVGCSFYDNEYGVLALNAEVIANTAANTAANPTAPAALAELDIERSLFGLAPRVAGSLPHLLNVGRIGRLSVTGSRFQQGYEGHMIKSRARESLIAYNFIHDGQRGASSYEIDLSAGGLATVLGNVIGQGVDSQNPVMVAYGAEGRVWERNVLHLSHNTLINNKLMPAWFLRVWRDRLPADTEVVALNNLLVGPGIFWLGAAGRFEGNYGASLGMLRDAETYAFELAPGSIWRGRGVDVSRVNGRDLSPKAEFEWPVGTRPLPPGPSRLSPGAFQR